MSSGVWVFAEQRNGHLQDVSLELLSEGRKIAGRLGEQLCAVLLGDGIESLGEVLGRYADTVYLVLDRSLRGYGTLAYTSGLAELVGRYRPSVVLIPATSIGKDFAPRLATRLGTGLMADAVILKVEPGGRLVVTRPVYGEKLYATVACPNARPQVITVRPGAMDIEDPGPTSKAEIIRLAPARGIEDSVARVVRCVRADPRTVDLTEAPVIVAGGLGVKGREGFRLLENLADALGGSVGGSRAAVDAGWLPFDRQIGQTGKTVAPSVYIACGISGAIQHTVGIKDARTVIAINTDPDAPIFKIAAVRIVGDLHVIVPAITRRLRDGPP